MATKGKEKLEHAVERDAERLSEARKNRPTLLAQTAFLGSLTLMFIIPVIGGAYLGRWIDGLFEGYSVRWTISLILLGVIAGMLNIWLFIRERQ